MTMEMVKSFIVFLMTSLIIRGAICYIRVCYYTNWSQFVPTYRFLPNRIPAQLCTHVVFAYADIRATNVTPTEFNDVEISPHVALGFSGSDHHMWLLDSQAQITTCGSLDFPAQITICGSLDSPAQITLFGYWIPRVRSPHVTIENTIVLYGRLNRLKRDRPSLQILLAVGGWAAGGEKFSRLVSSETSMTQFSDNLIAYLRRNNLDGVNIDWQYPTSRERGSEPGDRLRFTNFLQVR
ncbi:hypothetical protein Btru_003083 [Bulinus truncatus]|nr:hypothetical protein Btru_003083 [Bulinus truncatus]